MHWIRYWWRLRKSKKLCLDLSNARTDILAPSNHLGHSILCHVTGKFFVDLCGMRTGIPFVSQITIPDTPSSPLADPITETRAPSCQKHDYHKIPVGGRIQFFQDPWLHLSSDSWAQEVVREGYKIELIAFPPHRFMISPISKNKEKRMRTLQAAQLLLEAKAIDKVPLAEQGLGLYSLSFTVLKRNEKWRAVLDLKFLNKFVAQKHFRMETLRSCNGKSSLHRSTSLMPTFTCRSICRTADSLVFV